MMKLGSGLRKILTKQKDLNSEDRHSHLRKKEAEDEQEHVCTGFKHHSQFSQQVKVLAEVEKIWILYDLDDNDILDFDELKPYL